MSRKVVPLTLDQVAALDSVGEPCDRCLFWELDPVRRSRVSDPVGAKHAWAVEVLREWGTCGQVALVDGPGSEVAGFVLYAPAAFVPGAAGLPTAPVSPDAVVMTTVHVATEHARGGLGRMLVQAMARDLIERGGVRAVEAFGDTRGPGHCLPTVDFLTSVGFAPYRAHPTTPRLRMDLRAALTWKDEVGVAVQRVLKVVRPAGRPASAPEASRSTRQAVRTARERTARGGLSR